MKRVAITGLGLITPFGVNVESTWNSLISGRSGLKRIASFDVTEFPCKVAGEVKDFNPYDFFDKQSEKKMGRYSQFALAAAKMALDDSGLKITPENEWDVGVIVGSGIGGIEVLEENLSVLREKGVRRVSPYAVPAIIGNMAAGNIAIETGAKGLSKDVVTACASGNSSIGDAYEAIRMGKATAMIAGGAEACITPLSIAGFCAAKTLATNYNENPEMASRPFDRERNGFIMGEGAGIVILEDMEFAIARGAAIYAEIVGYGESNDAYHMTSPSIGGVGAAKAIEKALTSASLNPNQIGYICAHGTSSRLNDSIETAAIKRTFGQYSYSIPISSIKGAIGHSLGAAGAIEAVVTALALKNSIIPPTINYENFDPECDLNYVPNNALYRDFKYALNNSFGFGGHNSVLVLKKY